MKNKYKIKQKKVLLGLRPEEVNQRFEKQESYYQNLLCEQKQVIDELKLSLKTAENQLFIYKCKEDDIAKALISATEKAEEMEIDLKLQYAMEIERLKIFQAKWTNAYDELKEKYHFEKDSCTMEALVADTSRELQRLLHKDFGIALSTVVSAPEAQFKSELDRLSSNDKELSFLINELKKAL
jgi:hypothetical protein